MDSLYRWWSGRVRLAGMLQVMKNKWFLDRMRSEVVVQIWITTPTCEVQSCVGEDLHGDITSLSNV